MFPSPSHAVIGATDRPATISYLELFGLEVQTGAILPAKAAKGPLRPDGAPIAAAAPLGVRWVFSRPRGERRSSPWTPWR